jgi:hypothetical protein
VRREFLRMIGCLESGTSSNGADSANITGNHKDNTSDPTAESCHSADVTGKNRLFTITGQRRVISTCTINPVIEDHGKDKHDNRVRNVSCFQLLRLNVKSCMRS